MAPNLPDNPVILRCTTAGTLPVGSLTLNPANCGSSIPYGDLPPDNPAPLITVTVHVCPPDVDTPQCAAKRAQWQRKKDIEELLPLLLEDFKDTDTLPSRGRRDRITVIMERMAKHKYD